MTGENDNGNIHSINTAKDPNEAAAENIIRSAPSLARMKKALFDSYVKEGFTVDQAIKLLCM